jgi:SAM-dependent methyltransferase
MKIYDSSYFTEVKGIVSPKEQGWKFKKILPAYRKYIGLTEDSNINLIEIGSGAGLFLEHLIAYNHNKNIRITSLELNKDSLKYLRGIIPKARIIIGDIAKKTSFKTKTFDLCIGIDVIEHIPDFRNALDEITRISQYAIFKIPIEKSVAIRTVNALSLGRYRESAINTVGHINWFSDKELRGILKKHFRDIEYFAYANIGLYQYKKYISGDKSLRKILLIIWCVLSAILYKISPRINALIFGDHIVVLVKC